MSLLSNLEEYTLFCVFPIFSSRFVTARVQSANDAVLLSRSPSLYIQLMFGPESMKYDPSGHQSG